MGVTVDDLKMRLQKARPARIHGQPGINACCPAHEDKSPSFYAWEGEDGWLHMRCRNGCAEDQILGALQMTQEDRKLTNDSDQEPSRETVYIYRDADGAAVMRKIRIERYGQKKTFKLEGYVRGEWQYNLQGLNGQRHTLYNLPALKKAIAEGQTVYINEGEKACEMLAKQGLVGTCQAYGADQHPNKRWLDVHTQNFVGADVVVVADRDETGEGYAKYVAAQVAAVAKSVRIVQSKTKGEKDDAFDHFARGHKVEEFEPRPDLMPRRGLQTKSFKPETFTPIVLTHLIEPYIPQAKPILFDADGGTGKTAYLMGLAAALSRGVDPINQKQIDAVRTLYLHKGEDQSEELMTVYRANEGLYEGIEFYDGPLMLDNAGLKEIEETLMDGKFGLFIFDALFYFLSGIVADTNAPMEVMSMMTKLLGVCERSRASEISVRHTSKGQVGKDASNLGMGTVQFRNSHRGQLVARYHPTNKGLVVVTDEKGSLLNHRGGHFCFRRQGNEILHVHGIPNPFDTDADEPRVAKIDLAKALLRELCTAQFAKVSWIRQLAKERGIGWRTVESAKAELNVQDSRCGTHESHWIIRTEDDPFA